MPPNCIDEMGFKQSRSGYNYHHSTLGEVAAETSKYLLKDFGRFLEDMVRKKIFTDKPTLEILTLDLRDEFQSNLSVPEIRG